MAVKPLADNVVLKNCKVEETTVGGIVLTSAAQEKSQIAEVVAVGPGGEVDGKTVNMSVKVGDKVIFNKFSGTEVKIEDTEYIIVRNSDILCIVD